MTSWSSTRSKLSVLLHARSYFLFNDTRHTRTVYITSSMNWFARLPSSNYHAYLRSLSDIRTVPSTVSLPLHVRRDRHRSVVFCFRGRYFALITQNGVVVLTSFTSGAHTSPRTTFIHHFTAKVLKIASNKSFQLCSTCFVSSVGCC